MGGEPSTQETRGRGGEAGNCGQVGHAGGLGGRQVPPRAPPGRDVLRTGWHGPARGDSVHHGHRSIRGGGGGDLGQLCLRAVGLWWGDVIRHPAWGTWLGSGQSRRRRIPAGCEWGPTVRLGTPPRLLPNENQLYICFISAQRCSGPRGDEECGQQAVPWHCPSPCSFPSATCVSPSR